MLVENIYKNVDKRSHLEGGADPLDPSSNPPLKIYMYYIK